MERSAATVGSAGEATSVADLTRAITDRIRSGHYAPGQRLIEFDLVADFGVGRSRIRESLRQLEALGLVVIAPNRGALVRRLSESDVREFFETREVLEGLAARLVAERVQEGPIVDRLTALSAELTDDRIGIEVGRFLEHNEAFHAVFTEYSGNKVLQGMVAQLSTALFRLQFHRILTADALARAREEHEAVLSAVLRRDGAAAETRMRHHVRTSYDLYRSSG